MPSAEEILQKMRALQERREAAVGPLVEILAKRSELLAQLAALDESYGKAYVDAEAAGWTSDELTQLGADEPVKRPRVRSRRKGSAARKSAAEASEAAPKTDSPAVVPAPSSPANPVAPAATGTSA
ncbi:hypothetical protein ACFWII_34005 [Streptomyces sp. NPDC127063]|uniref:hypothetical protein n=1 Tax=Streptomyces sp. NPDC127063 TaxID=3347123 RepID=UPI003658E8DC